MQPPIAMPSLVVAAAEEEVVLINEEEELLAFPRSSKSNDQLQRQEQGEKV